jgi:carboxymethylenebutenolidase
VTEQRVAITTASGQIDCWLFQPQEAGSWPAIILHTDVKGVRESFINMGRRLSAYGFVVLLPNLYYRVASAPFIAPESSPRDEKFKEQFARLRESISIAGLHTDHQSLLNFLSGLPCVSSDKFGVVGYCMSGAIALRAAADFPQIVAAASFHGGRLATESDDSPHLRAGDIHARLYLGYAQDDASMTDEMIEKLEASLAQADVNFSSDHYRAQHGFAVTDNRLFDVNAAEQHWQNLDRLFTGVLNP